MFTKRFFDLIFRRVSSSSTDETCLFLFLKAEIIPDLFVPDFPKLDCLGCILVSFQGNKAEHEQFRCLSGTFSSFRGLLKHRYEAMHNHRARVQESVQSSALSGELEFGRRCVSQMQSGSLGEFCILMN